MCAKFANFYQEKCWNPVLDELKRNTTRKALRGKQKLQCKNRVNFKIYYALFQGLFCNYDLTALSKSIIFCFQILVMAWHMDFQPA